MLHAEAIAEGARRLAAAGIDTARLDAEVLLRHVLGADRTGLFLRLREPLPAVSRDAYDALVTRRAAGEPVAYLTGEKEFYGRPFAVGPGVLIPRPETELLVAWALAWLAGRGAATVADVGTGSGTIAITVAAELGPSWTGTIVGVDRSSDALRYAAANRDRLGQRGRVGLVQGHLLTWCRGPVDLILANLPYLRPEQVAGNPSIQAEPAQALVGGTDGLDLIRDLLRDAPRLLAPTGAIGLETDPSNAQAAATFARGIFPNAVIAVQPDLAGLDRLVLITRA